MIFLKPSDMFDIVMYADNTMLFCNFDTTCNSEKTYRWLCYKKVSLNVGETKFKQSLRVFIEHNKM